MKKGLFITLEGGEGSGKTTLLSHLKKWFEAEQIAAIYTREPGGTAFGNEIRKLVLETKSGEAPLFSRAETLLFLASRAQHVDEIIQPALENGVCVVCDRFSDSTVAYQGIARNLGLNSILDLCDFSTGGLQPDLTLYLDINPVAGLARAKEAVKGESHDRMEAEKLTFHEKVRHGFLLLAQMYPERIQVIQADASIEEVKNEAISILQKQFV